jgi:hypothetical protein
MKNSSPSISRLAVVTAMLACFLMPAAARAQSIARLNQTTKFSNVSDDKHAKAVAALRRLGNQVIVYRSLGEFEENGRLARVSLQTFEKELRDVTLEVQPIVAEMPPSKLRNEIMNALASYRDGLFWWRKIDQPRVVNVSALRYDEPNRNPANQVLLSNTPYTVVINWRQAHAYLTQAEKLLAK